MSFQRNSFLGRSVKADPYKAYIPTGFQKKEAPETNLLYDTLDTQLKSRTTFRTPVVAAGLFNFKVVSPLPFAAVGFVGSAVALYYMLR